MVEVTINNSECNISGLNLTQMSSLGKICSYWPSPKGSYASVFHQARPISLVSKKGTFPSGILYLVRKFLTDNNINTRYNDIRRPTSPKEGMFRANLPCTPYKEQEEAINACNRLVKGTVVMPTGTGKSITMCMLIQSLQLKTLIVVPNLTLKKQLSDTIVSIFGKTKNIQVENIDSPNLKKAKDFDCLILDEAHHSAARTYRKLNKTAWVNIYRRFFFTATPFRSRDEEQILYESIAGRVIYNLSYATSVANKLIVPIEHQTIVCPKVPTSKTTWMGVYKDIVVDNDLRNNIIAEVLLELYKAGKSTLCLVKEIAHGEKLKELTGFEFANGQNEDCSNLLDKFSTGGLKILIATTGVAGEGTDTKAAEYVIIAGLGKSKNALMQQIGRVVRTYPGKESGKVILFKDPSHRWSMAHYKEQMKIIKTEYNLGEEEDA